MFRRSQRPSLPENDKVQQKMAKYFNQRVKLKRFSIGDLVLRKVILATKDLAQGKLGPTWEEPYKVVHY